MPDICNVAAASPMGTVETGTFILAAIIIGCATAAVLFFLFGVKTQTRAQYRVVIVLLFFALSCVTSLLFSTTDTKFTGGFETFSFTVIGPAALWLGGLFLFFKFVPEESLFRNIGEDPQSLDAILKVISEVEKRQGWRMYSSWKSELRGGLSDLFDKYETSTLKSLLHTVYFTHNKEKLNDPRITTMWLYFEATVIKLQRIRGRKEGAAAWIRFGSNPTADSADAKSVFLVGDTAGGKEIAIARGFTESDTIQYRGLQEVAFEPVDCLIMTLYDDSGYEDYLLVDIKRFSQHNNGTVEIGVVSFDKQIQGTSLSVWTLKQPVFTPENEVPLAMRKELAVPLLGAKSIVDELKPWLAAVDKLLVTRKRNLSAAVTDAIVRIKTAAQIGSKISGETMSFETLLEASEKASSSCSYSMPSTHDVTMVLLRMID